MNKEVNKKLKQEPKSIQTSAQALREHAGLLNK